MIESQRAAEKICEAIDRYVGDLPAFKPDIASLIDAEFAEMERDAKRYRWLRSEGLVHINFHDLTPETCDVGLDAAIDAALEGKC